MKKVKARKIHTCTICEGNIQIGEKHELHEGRGENYTEGGIEFWRYRQHIRNCTQGLHLVGNMDYIKWLFRKRKGLEEGEYC